MAKIRLTSTLADLRGRLGGVVYSSNRSGAYIKRLVIPARTDSPRAEQARREFIFVAKLWPQLTQGLREDWEDFAALPENVQHDYWGDPYYLAGFHWFTRVNRIAQYVGESLPAPLPVSAIPNLPPPLSVKIDPAVAAGGSAIVALDDWQHPAGYAKIYMRLWAAPGRKFPPSPLAVFDTIPLMDFVSYDFQAQLIARFGAQQSVGRWFVRVLQVTADCRPGPPANYTGAFGETVT